MILIEFPSIDINKHKEVVYMKTTKRITLILLTFVTALIFGACGSESKSSVSEDELSSLQKIMMNAQTTMMICRTITKN